MISYLWMLLVGWACICNGGTIGSEPQNYIYSPTPTSLCDVIFSSRETLSLSLTRAFGLGDVSCVVQNGCRRLKCFSSNETQKRQPFLNFKIDLNLCQDNETVHFRAESFYGDKWSLITPLWSDDRYKVHLKGPSQNQLFLKMSTVKSASNKTTLLTSSLQSCKDYSDESETSCRTFPLFTLPYLHINLCDHTETKYLRKNRSSRSVVVDPQDLHTRRLDPSPISTSQIGRSCQLSNIHSCGKNAACVNKDGNGTCECLEGFVPASNGTCIISPVVDPSAHHGSSSYSPALGAFLAILLLLGMAASAFYGAKHQVLQRLRNRLPVSLRCWPYPVIRRARAENDNIAFAVPLE